ncbi:peptidase S8/S53 domain-containing protein [Lactarius quietus]|nr:peptidase S8/S53 domain-containing protein [Lactarius quietus]
MRYYHLSMLSVISAASLTNSSMPLVPRWDNVRVKHTWHTVPSNWESLGPPFFNTTIDLHIELQPQHENALIDALYEVSTPGNPKRVISDTPPYGAHLSKEQVAQLVAPHRDTLDLVNSWLRYHGIQRSSISVSHGGGWLTVAAVPVSRANEMLGASYQLYRESGTNDTSILRTISYGLPAVLHQHVRTVVPTTYFGFTHTPLQSPRRRSGTTEDMASRELGTLLPRGLLSPIVPMDLRWLYRTFNYVPAATNKNALGVVGYSRNYPNPSDLTTFMTQFRTNAKDATYTFVPINGGLYNPNSPTIEANQNIQYASALVYPTPVTFYNVGGGIVILPDSNKPAPGDAMLEWLRYVLGQSDLPKTISISHGRNEKDLPLEYAAALCLLYAQLGARGVTVLFPSGNDGVGKKENCQADGSGRVQFIIDSLHPDTAAGTNLSPQRHNFVGPYVTSVGGTTGGTGQGPEVAAAIDGTISGEASRTIFCAPPTKMMLCPPFWSSSEARAISRAVQAQQHRRVLPPPLGFEHPVDPSGQTAAGVISLLNDHLLSTDRAPLGFLNPLLYGHLRPAMNDITSGSNPGCNTPGFSAVPGWDPVTGLGTPDFLNLQALRDLMDIF